MTSLRRIGVVFLTVFTLFSCSEKEEDKPRLNPYLSLVPDDTLIFSGSLSKPYPNQKYVEHFADLYKFLSPDLYQFILGDLRRGIASSEHRFLFELLIATLETMQHPNSYLDQWGYPDSGHYVFYTVDGLPVIKFELEDSDDFIDMIKRVEKHAEYISEPVKIHDYEVRRYKLTEQGSELQLDLLIAVSESTVTFAIDVKQSNDFVETILSDTAVANPINVANLKKLSKQYGFDSTMFIHYNPQALYDGLYNKTNKQAMRLMSHIQLVVPNIDRYIDDPACRNEFKQASLRWGDVVSGENYSSDLDLYTYKSIEIFADSAWKDTMNSVMGKMPGYVNNRDGVLSLAIGVDLEKAMPLLSTLSACSFVSPIGSDNMAPELVKILDETFGRSFKGVAFNLYGFKFNTQSSNFLPSLDAVITFSSSNPTEIMSFVQKMFGFELDLTSTLAQELPRSLPGLKVYVQKFDDYVAIFTGPQSTKAVASLATNTKTVPMFSYFYFDTGRLISGIKNSFDSQPKSMESAYTSLYINYWADMTAKIEYLEHADDVGYVHMFNYYK